MLGSVLALVVRVETVFLWIVDNKVAGEFEGGFFRISFDFLRGQRRFETISDTFVVGAKHHGVPALGSKLQLVVVVANLRKLLLHHRLDHLVVCALLNSRDFGIFAELLMVDFDRERGILEYCRSLQDNIVTNLVGSTDPDLNAAIRRFQVIAGLRGRHTDSGQKKCKQDSANQPHGSPKMETECCSESRIY